MAHINYMITTPLDRFANTDVLCFNNIHNIVDINVNTWCKIFGITAKEYQLLTIKNPPLDTLTKSMLYFMAKVKVKYDYLAFMRIVDNMQGFLQDYVSDDLALHHCLICGTSDMSARATYCSNACRQKAYRQR